MPSYSMHPSALRAKVLFCGDSKMGKTGHLAALANAGYRLHIIDLDNGLDILGSYLTADGAANVYYETLDVNDKSTPRRVWELINHWKTSREDHGPTTKFGEKDIIVLDSLTFFANSCLALEKDEHGEIKDERQFFKLAGPAFEKVVAHLGSSKVPCNVIVNTHIRTQENESGGVIKMYPNALGRAQSKTIARYFNNVWLLKKTPTGKLVIRTKSDNLMALGSSAPNLIADEEEANLPVLFEKVKANAIKIKEIFEKK